MQSLISIREVTKVFGSKKSLINALGPVSLNVSEGEFLLILGRSGSGKSTLLNVISGLDKITSGELIVRGVNLSKASPKKLANYRSAHGVIFQAYNLLPNLTTVENVLVGSWAAGKNASYDKAEHLLEKFGLSHRLRAPVNTLSGGERQRVAICRALIGDPKILFCDEPTGALDTGSENQVKEILRELHQSGLTIVMVSHNPDFRQLATKTIQMSDGVIV